MVVWVDAGILWRDAAEFRTAARFGRGNFNFIIGRAFRFGRTLIRMANALVVRAATRVADDVTFALQRLGRIVRRTRGTRNTLADVAEASVDHLQFLQLVFATIGSRKIWARLISRRADHRRTAFACTKEGINQSSQV